MFWCCMEVVSKICMCDPAAGSIGQSQKVGQVYFKENSSWDFGAQFTDEKKHSFEQIGWVGDKLSWNEMWN